MVSALHFPVATRYWPLKGSPIPSVFLEVPAKVALVELLSLRIYSPNFRKWNPPQILSDDARLLLDICIAVREPKGSDLRKDIYNAVEKIVYELSYDTILKLALLTWHFNASSATASQELRTFLSCQSDNTVIVILQDRYQGIMGKGSTDDTFDILLVMD